MADYDTDSSLQDEAIFAKMYEQKSSDASLSASRRSEVPETIDEDTAFSNGEEQLEDGPQATQLWNAMIYPFLQMRFVGAVWYQGEANSGDPVSYYHRINAIVIRSSPHVVWKSFVFEHSMIMSIE